MKAIADTGLIVAFGNLYVASEVSSHVILSAAKNLSLVLRIG